MKAATGWPAPYLQPDRMKDCGYYAQAYLCHCLGHPDVTAEQIRDWRAETRIHESRYAERVLGAEYKGWGEYELGTPEHTAFWLGPGTREWLTGWLAGGWIAQVGVNRIASCGHAVVVLAASDDGVLLMDPIYGHVTEPWEWFLGPGGRKGDRSGAWPGSAPDGRQFYGCHYIEGWYRG